MNKSTIILFAVFAALFLFATPVFASEGDPTSGTIYDGLIQLATPVISLLVTAGVKRVIPKIPGFLLPVVASAVGALSFWFATKFGAADLSALHGLAYGAVAVALHQLKVQIEREANGTPIVGRD